MTFNSERDYWASFKANEKAFIIQTYSGLGMIGIDHLYPPHILPLDTNDKILGDIVLQALANSRTLNNEAERIDFFDFNKETQRHIDWLNHLYEKLGYKTKRALFKNMMSCTIWLNNGRIKISPSRHVKLEAWEGIKGVENVIVTLDNTPEEIGAGLRLALSRCR
ncbi:contact-dependent growth inhibition system immunity protein [Neisseria yangbaofengii]|uniref:contact-dependent growth inhibition system immunity protein n=1 Tax=Neisseria yangbaofengii TaxID=2709396 RepID=UPI0013EB5A54|nr:contact-dependent growth inhibition system immunity protein [Neisseria yangbaofengii]